MMKNAKAWLTAAVFTAAVAGAFATNASKEAAARSGSVPGYIKQGLTCVFKNNCQDVNNGILCTETQTGGAQVFGMTDATHCAVTLWRQP